MYDKAQYARGFVAAPILLALSAQCHSTLIGDTVDLRFDAQGGFEQIVVTEAPEYVAFQSPGNGLTFWDVDIQASSITAVATLTDAEAPLAWNPTLDIGGFDWVGSDGVIDDVTLTVVVNVICAGNCFVDDISAFPGTFITSGSDPTITIGSHTSSDSIGVLTGSTYTWTAELSTTHAAVPEPVTISLIGLGLAGLGFTRRKMKA